jgi:hypothetical protein
MSLLRPIAQGRQKLLPLALFVVSVGAHIVCTRRAVAKVLPELKVGAAGTVEGKHRLSVAVTISTEREPSDRRTLCLHPAVLTNHQRSYDLDQANETKSLAVFATATDASLVIASQAPSLNTEVACPAFRRPRLLGESADSE